MLMPILPAIVLIASATVADPNEPQTTEPLTASEITALLATRSEVPQNCTVFGDPCAYIVCGTPTQPGDWPRGLYTCEVD